ncbi:imidazolonepropionase [soil metagenome]
MRILIKDIHTIIQIEEGEPRTTAVKGSDMKHLPRLEKAWLMVKDDIIEDFGTMESCPDNSNIVISAEGKWLFPSWCDSHTHLVYADSREGEFVMRTQGASYEEIAAQGGGILNSARKLNETSEEDLVKQSLPRLKEIMMLGTGAVEIKSGYGLTLEGELKMLRVIKKLKKLSPMHIKATFLGAHAIPLEYRDNRQGYIDLIIKKMLPKVAEERLADYIDVFCDQGFFTVEETDAILQAGAHYGLKPKIHANELAISGGVQVGVKNNAISVDHLERISIDEIMTLLDSNTMPTALPGTSFFLGIDYAPVRQMLNAGLPVCLATDYNPGSTPSGRMVFVLTLACLKMGLLPEEAINAVTINGAVAMECLANFGTIARGKKANFFLTKPMSSLALLAYSYGSELIDTVFVNGQAQNE